MTAQEYFIRAEVACMGEDYATAQQLFVKCLELEPEVREVLERTWCLMIEKNRWFIHRRVCDTCVQNAQFLDGYGAFLAEYGGRQEAIPVLQKACAASPENGFEKFMYVSFHSFCWLDDDFFFLVDL